ncbi:MAG: hydroxymethylbilane synthase [Elusimicrobiota bacterium]
MLINKAKKNIIIATRQSRLALAQTCQVLTLLSNMNPDYSFELKKIISSGDRIKKKPLYSMRGMGVFVKELENALLQGKADLAVHSLKDVPSDQADGLTLAAFPQRECALDVLLTKEKYTLATLPPGATVGTGSPRRLIQLRAVRPDLEFSDLRGNLETRINKLNQGRYDAIIVAAAGMIRLNLKYGKKQVLPCNVCVPAVGQGALAVQCRAGHENMIRIARSINHEATEKEVKTERIFMKEIGTGCSAPVAAYAKIIVGRLRIRAIIADPISGEIIRHSISCNPEEYEKCALLVARRMLAMCRDKGINYFTVNNR